MTTRWNEWTDWVAALPPDFGFLLVLPLLVAAAGLLRWIVRRD